MLLCSARRRAHAGRLVECCDGEGSDAAAAMVRLLGEGGGIVR